MIEVGKKRNRNLNKKNKLEKKLRVKKIFRFFCVYIIIKYLSI